MRSYCFKYIDGSSGPEKTLEAKDDLDFYRQLNDFLGNRRKLVAGSISFIEMGKVPDPPLMRSAA